MKKLVLVLALVFIASPALAMNVTLNPYASGHLYEDAENAMGMGLDAKLTDLGVDNLSVTTGLESVQTEIGSTDLDVLDWKSSVGYEVAITENLSVTPKVGFDVYFLNTDGSSSVDNSSGIHTGVDLAYNVAEDISVSAGVTYSWADEQDGVNLDNLAFTAGVSIAL